MTTIVLLFVTAFISILFAFALFSHVLDSKDSFLENRNFYPVFGILFNGIHIISIDGQILNPFSISLSIIAIGLAVLRLRTLAEISND